MSEGIVKKISIAVASIAVAAIVGAGAGAAIAVVPTMLSPAGLSPALGVANEAMPEPVYPVNDSGQTYGSAAEATSPDSEPDLILVIADDGREGYVKKAELDAVNGAGTNFTSPEEALAWQEASAGVDHTVPVYGPDGTKVIGTFTVHGQSARYTE